MKTYNRTALFNLAWSFIRTMGLDLSQALKLAWRQIKNKVNLKKGITHFQFRKIDGTLRDAWGTIKSELVPTTNGNRKYNPTIQTYYDTQKGEWRCYKIANLIAVGLPTTA